MDFLQANLSKVIIGLRHPLTHLRGKAIEALRAEGITVEVLGEDLIEGEQLQVKLHFLSFKRFIIDNSSQMSCVRNNCSTK